MADFDYFGADYGAEAPSRLADAIRGFGLVNWAGALTSIGLTAGLATWAIDLTFRDVSTVPVIVALDGPMRVAPEDPGGTVAPHQGMAISDITGGGAATPAPEEIVLAPPPVALDAPALAARVAAVEAAVEDSPAEQVAIVEAAPEDDAEAMIELAALEMVEMPDGSEAVDADMAEAEPIEAAPEPLTSNAIENSVQAALMEALGGSDAASSVTDGRGIATSIRPKRRPTDLRSALAAPSSLPIDAPAAGMGVQVASIDPVRPAAIEVDPATIAAGSSVVQLGAFDSAGVARAEWDRLAPRFRDYFDGKKRAIQKAGSEGRTIWRLRVVGFADGDEARRFCSELSAQGASCFPVTAR
ncbi:SPOR domain-containing protein [uncultured Jannaschia sp.]|uniref:SPOR domain-containing protein n=1 Tax=uncultured Jannaschia sp. TaxID=293347 RepID=UPI00261AB4CF|nr:SPOR domain-containing protein [uncultured Jannaschia sp.]